MKLLVYCKPRELFPHIITAQFLLKRRFRCEEKADGSRLRVIPGRHCRAHNLEGRYLGSAARLWWRLHATGRYVALRQLSLASGVRRLFRFGTGLWATWQSAIIGNQ